MDMNRVFYLKKEARKPKWRVIDAKDQILGRLATQLADIIRGKDKSHYAPHVDVGDYVIVINADKIKLTGNKWENKQYDRYTMYMGGLKTRTAKEVRALHPTMLVKLAVKRMLPKNNLSNDIFSKLKVYAGANHPHRAQISQ